MEEKNVLPDRVFSGLDQAKGKDLRWEPDRAADAEGAQPTGSGLTGIMDMSDPIKDVYLALLKEGDMSMQQIRDNPAFQEMEEREALPIYVKILVRQGYLERYKDEEVLKYRALTGGRGKRTVSDDIWDALL